jgi:hypothetical protein
VIDHDWNKPCPHGLVGEAAMWCLDCESDAAKAPAPAPASPPVGEPAPAEHGMEEIEAVIAAVRRYLADNSPRSIIERSEWERTREIRAAIARLDALTAAASAATKGDDRDR